MDKTNYYGYEMYYTLFAFYIVYPDLTYTNFCTNFCVNSTSIFNIVNDFGEIIDNYFSTSNSPFGDEPDTDCKQYNFNSTINQHYIKQ